MNPSEPPNLSGRRADCLIALALAVGTVALHLSALWGDFIFDAELIVLGDRRLHSFGQWREWLLGPYWPLPPAYGLWRPLVTASYGLNWAMGDGAAWPFHLTTIVVHAAVTALVFIVARRLGLGRAGAAMAGALFAVHPVHTEVAAAIVYRTDSMVTLAMLAATAVFLGRGDTPLTAGRVALVLLLFALGLGCKENAVLLPILLAVSLVTVRPSRWGDSRDWLLVLAAGFAVLIAVHVAALIAVCGLWGVSSEFAAFPDAALHERLAVVPWTIGQYARLLLWPMTLSAEYRHPLPEATTWRVASSAGFVLAVAVCWVGASLWLRRRAPVAAFGFLWTGMAIAPYLHLIPFAAVLAERFAYLASVGVCWAVAALWETLEHRRRRQALGALLLIMALFAGRSARHAVAWSDRLSLWEASAPTGHAGWNGWYLLADARLRSSDPRGAREALERSVDEGLDGPGLFVTSVLIERAAGNLSAAERFGREGLERFPRHAEISINLAMVLGRRAAHSEARHILEDALEDHPDDDLMWGQLAFNRMGTGDVEGAAEAATRALELGVVRSPNLEALCARLGIDPDGVTPTR